MSRVAAWDHSQTISEDVRRLGRFRAGDESVVADLVAAHRLRLVRVASNILRDRTEAEDVAQEAFLKALRTVHKLRDDRAFAGFLYRICVHLCLDRLRLRHVEAASFETAIESHGSRVETRVFVEALLDRMSPEFRAALVLREMEQLSYEEIAEVLHVPLGTVRSRLHAAREKFRVLYREATGEE